MKESVRARQSGTCGRDLFPRSFNPALLSPLLCSLYVFVQPAALHHFPALDIVAKQDGGAQGMWRMQEMWGKKCRRVDERERPRRNSSLVDLKELYIITEESHLLEFLQCSYVIYQQGLC